MSRSLPTRRLILGVLLVAFAVAACAGSSGTILSKVGAAVDDSQTYGRAPGASAAPYPAAGGASGSGSGEQGSNAVFRDDAKIVRTGSLSLQVDDLAAAVRTARDAIRGINGYVAGSSQKNDGDNSIAEVTYRIPSDRWDEGLDAIRKVATKVVGEDTSAVEVTGQLVDLEARIANLRASEKAFQAIAAQATKISDILEVQNQLTNVRGQIEQLDAQRSHLSDQASYGTLNVTYGVQVAAVTTAAKGWNPGQEADRATASLVGLLQGVTTAGIWFAIVWLPILLMIGIVVAIVSVVLRRTGVIRRGEPPTPAPIG
jgi:Domain of unknown function (DUF4349)